MLTEKSSTSYYWNQEKGLNQGKASDTNKIKLSNKELFIKNTKKKKKKIVKTEKSNISF